MNAGHMCCLHMPQWTDQDKPAAAVRSGAVIPHLLCELCAAHGHMCTAGCQQLAVIHTPCAYMQRLRQRHTRPHSQACHCCCPLHYHLACCPREPTCSVFVCHAPARLSSVHTADSQQDACGLFNCGSNPKRVPAPQLNAGEATADLCCVVPAVQRPQVQLAVPAASCSAADNEKLALEMWRQLTQGLTTAEAALIVVEVKSCSTNTVRALGGPACAAVGCTAAHQCKSGELPLLGVYIRSSLTAAHGLDSAL